MDRTDVPATAAVVCVQLTVPMVVAVNVVPVGAFRVT